MSRAAVRAQGRGWWMVGGGQGGERREADGGDGGGRGGMLNRAEWSTSTSS